MLNDPSIPYDRITYRDGQLLTARDLNDEQQRHLRLRAAHNRYLHATWGIALGFSVQLLASNDAVAVTAGYAIDEAGGDLVLSRSVAVPLPTVQGPEMFVLTIAAGEVVSSCGPRQSADICQNEVDSARPNFQWRRPLEARFGMEVPLAAVTVAGGLAQGGLNLRVRRYARPDVRPHMGFDTTDAGSTGWAVWGLDTKTTIGVDVMVDTTTAGFHQVPQYFAVLRGDFSNRAGEPELFDLPVWATGNQAGFSPGNLGFIAATYVDHFVYRVPCVGPPFKRTVMPAEAEDRGWQLTWLGLESATGAEPALDFLKLIPLFISF